ncbi:BirA family biotin operon repressor/biotin-[acetyl-CoA-carboxylase] ligase [Acetivibrio thermocellus AD2]|jgi:BirA family biotin operon repressor/biotin-[acetyl-CoA-carboxylase] ligase|uniref:Bifunctional ligase/repressor BirA n=1 Tax=Acetivibrio thermocellus AD2 TaxID=1138384 RepID=A0AB36TBT9_ACETH|nr:biotin--[acetyl-CoA-carboxylase] ligase [Acetivibrio thermocellus]ADU73267.1 biotin/acetyl-CoA-carboxylase ligase [Acetivibrio thermocellus DSM 1313]ALX07185.1 BirA bifunctional protein, biotin operon repressor and biotin/acetyl-CoA-carboxylase ligase [Acetivibrio thermocellus AD2]ANV74921.1 BirA bifunctional protein, biotin operon repressor and biotin/acetyl-CoA-carboxylase ligase [Acetivibrio thermocellus DSM 2360]EIC04349.1 biotin/acetyl-CoA-carboxylase ligase [Acetivibrio thermocellus YS
MVKVKEVILKKLKESTQNYVSGEELSNILGVSRTAVWKCINELKKEGYVIDSSSKKGYKLCYVPDIINSWEIKEGLGTRIIGQNIHCFSEIDSTNNYAKTLAQKGCDDGTVVLAEHQTQGRGRLGRSWDSMGGKGIWMSIVLRPAVGLEDVQIITLAAAVAVVLAFKKVMGIDAGIKWPNDIVLDGKKVCGILTEMSMEMERINFLILGIGINFSHEESEFPEEIRDRATSLGIYLKEKKGMDISRFKRSHLIRAILSELEEVYDMINEGKAGVIVEEWKKYSVTLGKEVVIKYREEQYTGIAQDVDQSGRLIVKQDDGTVREILSGEVSVRGLLGYT